MYRCEVGHLPGLEEIFFQAQCTTVSRNHKTECYVYYHCSCAGLSNGRIQRHDGRRVFQDEMITLNRVYSIGGAIVCAASLCVIRFCRSVERNKCSYGDFY